MRGGEREKIRDTQECFPEQWELDPGAHTIQCSLSFCLAQHKSKVYKGERQDSQRLKRKG